jgi:hypothetical protein
MTGNTTTGFTASMAAAGKRGLDANQGGNRTIAVLGLA